MHETSVKTSFAHLLTGISADVPIRRIEIPLIQRDYAQGRADDKTTRIRSGFLDVLHSALVGDAPVPIELDFVYGDVKSEDHALRPLDGQQRLTTLFLLHWYVAQKLQIDLGAESWTAFSYATRPSARLFCERIVAHVPPPETVDPSSWIADQPWFQYVWRHDPTILAMLTMLHDISVRFADVDLDAIWRRLTSTTDPAISFHLLPIRDMGSPETLYIKMNSRGKPLTEFENLKARLESTVADIDPATELAHKIDGPWTDVFWRYRGDDDLVDDEMLRFVMFLIELGEWKQRLPADGSPEQRARALFAAENPEAKDRLQQFIAAFDTWVGIDIDAYFSELFVVDRRSGTAGHSIPLFGTDARSNLFEACISTYGETRGSARAFSFGQQLLLSAVLAYRTRVSTSVDEALVNRMRQIRNLIEASDNEIRLDNMAALVDEVEAIAIGGLAAETTTFNRAQWDDEISKEVALGEHDTMADILRSLEDNDLLRGSLLAFELDADVFESRALAFAEAFNSKENWPRITAALLAAGDYARPRDRQRRSFQFGVGESGAAASWRIVLTTGTRDSAASLRRALGIMLDAIAASPTATEALDLLATSAEDAWEAAHTFDWRYYLVRYHEMREGKSGIYYGLEGAMGYTLCMLDKTQLNSYYRDPFLLAVWRASGVGQRVNEPIFYAGFEWSERWMTLARSGVRIRCVADGFAVTAPSDDEFSAKFGAFAAEEGINDGLVVVPQNLVEDRNVDSVDRIVVGASLIRRLVERGF